MPLMTTTSRRAFVAGLGASAAGLFAPVRAWAGQAATPLLPIRTPKIDHLDVIVPNVEA